jgi:hypothetical protein
VAFSNRVEGDVLVVLENLSPEDEALTTVGVALRLVDPILEATDVEVGGDRQREDLRVQSLD